MRTDAAEIEFDLLIGGATTQCICETAGKRKVLSHGSRALSEHQVLSQKMKSKTNPNYDLVNLVRYLRKEGQQRSGEIECSDRPEHNNRSKIAGPIVRHSCQIPIPLPVPHPRMSCISLAALDCLLD